MEDKLPKWYKLIKKTSSGFIFLAAFLFIFYEFLFFVVPSNIWTHYDAEIVLIVLLLNKLPVSLVIPLLIFIFGIYFFEIDFKENKYQIFIVVVIFSISLFIQYKIVEPSFWGYTGNIFLK